MEETQTAAAPKPRRITVRQWMNRNRTRHNLCILCLFVLVLIVLCMCRKQLFRNMFVKLFIDAFYDDEDE